MKGKYSSSTVPILIFLCVTSDVLNLFSHSIIPYITTISSVLQILANKPSGNSAPPPPQPPNPPVPYNGHNNVHNYDEDMGYRLVTSDVIVSIIRFFFVRVMKD